MTPAAAHPLKPTTIMLAEPRLEVVSALRLLLEEEQEFEVIGHAHAADQIVDMTAESKPDLLLIDWSLFKHSHKDLILLVRNEISELKIIVMYSEGGGNYPSMDMAANAYVSKAEPPDKLLSTIRRVCRS